MFHATAIVATDSVSRDGIRMASRVHYKMLSEHWLTGLPQLISHDAHRLAGWVLPTMLRFGPEMVQLHADIFMPETADEQEQLSRKYQELEWKRSTKLTESHISELKQLLSEHLHGNEKIHGAHGTCLVGDGLAIRAAPHLFQPADKDGLVQLKDLPSVAPGVFRFGKLVLFAHPAFRRSLSRWNSLNEPLLSELRRLSALGGATVRIKLDPDMVGLAGTIRDSMEWQYWYGPKFSDDLHEIPAGLSVHLADERQKFFNSVSKTEFWWQSRDHQHIFEAEEVRDRPTFSTTGDSYGCRYVHSIVNEDTAEIVHFDGAIREYSEIELLDRLDKSINNAGRDTGYTKLWRVDGRIPLSAWKLLLHHHFRDNDLIAEYLEPNAGHRQAFRNDDQSKVTESETETLGASASIQFLLSLEEYVPCEPEARIIGPLRYLSGGDERFDIIEYSIVELTKALVRRGNTLTLPDHAKLVAFEDLYINFPLIRHRSVLDLSVTLQAFRDLFEAWATRNEDRRISFIVAAPMSGRELRLAVAGTAQALRDGLLRMQNLFDCADEEDTERWIDETADFVRQHSNDAASCRGLVTTPSASFSYDRSIIPPSDIHYFDDSTFRLSAPADEETAKLVASGELLPATAWIVSASECSRCKGEYSRCGCSTVLDDDVVQECTDFTPAYLFWTDRPARNVECETPPLPREE